MRLSELDYELPEELIAQSPMEPRDASRLLIVDRTADTLEDAIGSRVDVDHRRRPRKQLEVA